jgi:tryptophan synthase alpha chain
LKSYNGFYLVGNYPDPESFIEGAIAGMQFFDFLEVGIPFSDPIADGLVIARAANEMLSKGVTLESIVESILLIRQRTSLDKQIYIMSYANHLYHYGIGEYARLCNDIGVSGIIIPDVPFIESIRFKKAFTSLALDYVHFITPENTTEQIEAIARAARGFLYAVSIRGVTGSDLALDRETVKKIEKAREHSTVPVVLGFGVKSAQDARNALKIADGFIMGTKMIELLSERNTESFQLFIASLKNEFLIEA